MLNDGVVANFIHMTVRGVFVLADLIRLATHVVGFGFVASSLVSEIGEEEVLVLQKSKLTGYLVL